MLLIAAGCDGLTIATTERTAADTGAVEDTAVDAATDTAPDTTISAANRCGGDAPLIYRRVAAGPGDSCGLCGDGQLFCSGTNDLTCAGASQPNDCGGCGLLVGDVGTSCGLCGDGVWACGGGSSTCLGDRPPTGCGGCTALALEPGTECPLVGGETGVVVCAGREISRCASVGTNGCGGTAPLTLPAGITGVEPRPGVVYEAGCRRGVLLCDGATLVAVDLEGGNACGGCEPLLGEPGASCDACGGVWVCAVEGGVRCDGGGRNACGGCDLLASEPGSGCNEGGTAGVVICIGAEETDCVQPGATNDCGGLGTLSGGALGSACGACRDGVVACDPTDASRRRTACTGASAQNDCGGCEPLTATVGSPCGTCGSGAYACDATVLVCSNVQGGAVANVCGGCATLAAAPGEACGRCGSWACDSVVTGRLACVEPPSGCAAAAVCGNGAVETGEGCDDGNAVTEECAYGLLSCSVCNVSCQSVAGETDFCTDGVVDATEFCDDGNTSAADACNNSCTCGTGFHPQSGLCVTDTRTCTVANATAATETWTGSTYGACTATGCDASYHLETGACASDTRSCSIANGTGSQTYATGSWGSCGIVSCNSTYHLEAGACSSDTRSCSIANGTGSQSWSGSGYGSCAPASCNVGYRPFGSICIRTICGDAVVDPTEQCDDGNAVTEVCAYGLNACEVCDATCQLQPGAVTYCGNGLVDGAELCDDGDGSETNGCTTGCVCSSAYHLESGACVSDTRSCSPVPANTTAGTQTWTGSAYGSCTASACASTYHIESGACVSDTRSCSAANATAATESWTGTGYGVCTISACSAGYALVANSCVGGCGNGVVGSGETCDDGNAVTEQCAYGDLSCTVCNATCQSVAGETNFCTDGVLDATEFCDDGNTSNADFCNNSCTCGTAYHAQGGVCASNVQACAISFGTGSESWNGSSYGACTPTSCDSGYHAAGNVCAANVISCSLANATAATQTWNSGTSSYGSCTATACASAFHVESGACVSDTRSCSPLPANTAAGTQIWNSGTSSYGSCTASACATSYHVESSACASDTRSCAIANATAATESWTGTGYGVCTISACSAGYALVANSCVGGCGNGVIDGTELCDDANTVTEQCAYGDVSCTVCNATCQSVAGETDFCTDGVLDPAEFCDDGNTSNTDACNNSCACSTGYHAQGGICANDLQACAFNNGTATETWTGSAYGLCTLTACNSGYHANGNACDADVISCSTANATAATQSWNGSAYGSCTASACASGYSAVGGVCLTGLGGGCTLNTQCASGFCATGPDGTTNDRCAPEAMTYIPAGTFTMGSPSGEVVQGPDETQHSVTLSRSFFMGQTEVTQGQWKAFSGGTNPSSFQSATNAADYTSNANDSGPAENMDWYAAVAFANAKSAAEGLTSCYTLAGCTDAASGWQDGIHSGCTGATLSGLTCTGYRLPTESEWEYAARAGTSTATYLGNLSVTVGDCTTAQANLDGIAWWCKNSGSRTQAVGGKPANSFGLYDMLGNVREWTGDRNGIYPGTVTDPLGATTGSFRVDRGGSWAHTIRDVRAANRDSGLPNNRYYARGFRLARTVTRGCTTALPINATAGVEAGNATGWGACEATACATPYHVESSACVLDTRSCSPLPSNTTAGTQTWDSATSAYGACTASACASGYSVVGGVCLANLGIACTANIECASGFCATGPDGTSNDRCAPSGLNYIPAGTFTMGSPAGEVGRFTDETQHSVTLTRSFFMGQTEVTQGQWRALSGGTNPSCFQSTTGTVCTTTNANDTGPVENLDWFAVVAFANARSAGEGLTSCYALEGCTDAADGWKDGTHSGCTGATFGGLDCTGYRLPTESEWEYAARAGTTTATYGGDLSATTLCVTLSGTGAFAAGTAFGSLAWYGFCNSGLRTHSVAGQAANNFGLYDVLGNVGEWTGDWYGSYPDTMTDPLGAGAGPGRVSRGGSFVVYARYARAASRNSGPPDARNASLGLRLARTAP